MTTFTEYLLEQEILNSPMFEMANLSPNKTGIGYSMWFGKTSGQHGPRIKVSNIKGRFAEHDSFVIALAAEPWIATPRTCTLKQHELDDIFDWIKLNYDDLMIMWNIYETGNTYNGMDVDDIINRLKKL